jgi:transcriptional regulator with XRE-family HTH domain
MLDRQARTRAPQPTDKHVGSRIRMRRHMLGLSQGSLGEVIGVTFQQIQKYENGKNRVGASRLQQIADALRCRPAWFFETAAGLGSSKIAAGRRDDSEMTAFFADKYAPGLVRAFVRLKPQAKRAIVKLIAAAAERSVRS